MNMPLSWWYLDCILIESKSNIELVWSDMPLGCVQPIWPHASWCKIQSRKLWEVTVNIHAAPLRTSLRKKFIPDWVLRYEMKIMLVLSLQYDPNEKHNYQQKLVSSLTEYSPLLKNLPQATRSMSSNTESNPSHDLLCKLLTAWYFLSLCRKKQVFWWGWKMLPSCNQWSPLEFGVKVWRVRDSPKVNHGQGS